MTVTVLAIAVVTIWLGPACARDHFRPCLVGDETSFAPPQHWPHIISVDPARDEAAVPGTRQLEIVAPRARALIAMFCGAATLLSAWQPHRGRGGQSKSRIQVALR